MWKVKRLFLKETEKKKAEGRLNNEFNLFHQFNAIIYCRITY